MDRKKIRVETLQKRLAMYYEAEGKILKGQSYTIDQMQLTRADLSKVQSKIEELENELYALQERGTAKRRSVQIIPMD